MEFMMIRAFCPFKDLMRGNNLISPKKTTNIPVKKQDVLVPNCSGFMNKMIPKVSTNTKMKSMKAQRYFLNHIAIS